MLRKLLILAVAGVLCISSLSGCGKDPGEQEEVKTFSQHKADAEKEITAENMDDELAKIEKEMTNETE